MTDREQIRRHIEEFKGEPVVTDVFLDATALLVRDCEALLAELEQAERERDEHRTRADAVIARHAYAEAQLAKVPALVEALRQIARHGDGPAAGVLARDALATWEKL